MSDALTTVPTLTREEDSFALAIIEYGGNFGAAYRSVFGEDVRNPTAKARELLTRPEIAKRIQQLSIAVEEHAYISLGSHMMKLAEIRDLAIDKEQLKTALSAEQLRGQAAGYYQDKTRAKDPDAPNTGKASITINIGASSNNVQDWAKNHGAAPVVIDI